MFSALNPWAFVRAQSLRRDWSTPTNGFLLINTACAANWHGTPLSPRPQVSIVTPSYNQGDFVEETILSVVQQRSSVDVEYLLFDAQSTDATADVLLKHAGDIDHLHVGPDAGQADALAQGFAQARGEILAYLNSDDTLLPGALAWVVEYFRTHPEVDACLLYTSPSPRDQRGSRMPSSA